MRRFARIMWWRSGCAALVAIVLALEAPSLLECREVVGVNWMSALEVANGSAVLLIILAVLVGATLAVRWSDRLRTFDAAPDGRRLVATLLPAAVVGATIAATHLLWTGFVLALAGPGTTGEFAPAVLLPPVLGVLGSSAFGYVVGSVVRSWFVPPLLALGLYAGLVSSSSWGGAHMLLDLGWLESEAPEARVRDAVPWAQALFYLTVLLCAAVGVRTLWARRRVQVAALVSCCALLAVATGPARAVGTDRFELAPVTWRCTTTAPRFCAISQEQDLLQRRLPRLLVVAHRWESLALGEPPRTYWQFLTWPVSGHDVAFPLREDGSEQSAAEVIIAANSPCQDHWTETQWNAEDDVISGLIGTGLDDGDSWDPVATRAAAKLLAC